MTRELHVRLPLGSHGDSGGVVEAVLTHGRAC